MLADPFLISTLEPLKRSLLRQDAGPPIAAHYTKLAFVLFLAATILASSSCKKQRRSGSCIPFGAGWNLDVPLYPQETPMWCWAASGQMAMHYLGTSVQQCVEANAEFGYTDCCQINVLSNKCVKGGYPPFDEFGFDADWEVPPLTWDGIQNQLYCLHKPVVFAWDWVGGGGHVLVLTGYVQAPYFGQMVAINDPWPPHTGDKAIMSYQFWISGCSDGLCHTFQGNYINLTKRTPTPTPTP